MAWFSNCNQHLRTHDHSNERLCTFKLYSPSWSVSCWWIFYIHARFL